jgi:hypothetical protein
VIYTSGHLKVILGKSFAFTCKAALEFLAGSSVVGLGSQVVNAD